MCHISLRTCSAAIPTRRRVATVLLCVGDWCAPDFDQFTAAAAAAGAEGDDVDDDDWVMIVVGKWWPGTVDASSSTHVNVAERNVDVSRYNTKIITGVQCATTPYRL